MSKNFKFITVALSMMLCFAAMAFGQRTSGNIEGTITDPNGAVVPNATVTARATGTTAGFNQTVAADANGYFQFPQVPPGTYQVTATGSGFQTSRQEVNVVIDKAANANFQLVVGGGETVVDVTADSAVTIDPGDTKIDTNITKQIIEDLPAGTQFSSLLKIAPNVRPEALAGGFQIDGASGSENVFVIDGQEVTNFRTGSLNSNFNLPFELLQEVQIKSTGYEAEYGGATGGIINVVTAGGNDNWRGNFGASFRPAKLQGSSCAPGSTVVANTQCTNPILTSFTAGGLTNAPGNSTLFEPASDGGTGFFPVAQISGPIIKEKLWFSAVYAPQIFEITRDITYFSSSDPSSSTGNPATRIVNQNGTIRYNQTFKQEEMFVRLDAAPISRLRLFGTFLYNPITQDGVLPSTNEGLSGAPQGALGLSGAGFLGQQGGRQNANAVNGGATWNPTNYLVLNFRAGRSFLNEKLASYGLPRITRSICSVVTNNSPTNPDINPTTTGCAGGSGFQNIANNFQINYDVSTRTTFDADASLVGINALGRHNFKFGYQYNGLFNTVDQGYADLGIVQLFYDRHIGQLGTPIAPSGPFCSAGQTSGCIYGSGLMQRFGTIGEASSTNNGLFAQDSWTISNRLTLNLGIRIESEVVPSFGDEATSQAIEFGWGDKVSPRLGVAFDLTGDGKTKIFANFGQFYDRFKYELPRGSFGGDFFRRDYFEILPVNEGHGLGPVHTAYTFPIILGSNPDPIGGDCPIVGGTGISRCQFDFRIATNLVGADIFETGAIDPDIKAARQSEWTVGLERELGQNFVLAARYTHKQIDRTVEDVGVFNAEGSEAYIIGNPGQGLVCEIADASGYPCPKAQRDYDAVEVRVDKRASNYFFNASYTWSRLFGNYSGLASSDEGGRTSPNVNRFFDLPPLGFTATGEPDNGLLATDRTHVFKAYGGYSFDWRGNNVNRTSVTAFTTFQSGTPLTTIYNLYSLGTTVLFERGDLGRTEMFTETDLSVNHRYKFGRDNRFTLEGFVDIRNLFNEDNVLGVQNNIGSTNFVGGGATSPLVIGGCTGCTGELETFDILFGGGGIQTFVVNFLNNTNPGGTVTPLASRTLNTYGQANNFQIGRDVRFGFRFFF